MFKAVSRAYRFIGKQLILLAPSDLREFSEALRREFPEICFYVFRDRGEVGRMDSYGPRTSPPDATAIGIQAAPEEAGVDQLTPTRLVYFDTLADCDDWRSCWVKLNPPDWTPIWERNADGEWIATNSHDVPDFEFRFSKFLSKGRRGVFRTELHAESDGEEVVMDRGSWSGGFYPWEEDRQKFLKRVRRIFDRMTTNQYSVVDPTTLEVTHRSLKGDMIRIGEGALAWSRAHPRHFLFRSMKPIDWNPP